MFAATTGWSELSIFGEKRALAELVDVACFSKDTSPHVLASVAGVSQDIVEENTVRAQAMEV